jgi:hypothetical protein
MTIKIHSVFPLEPQLMADSAVVPVTPRHMRHAECATSGAPCHLRFNAICSSLFSKFLDPNSLLNYFAIKIIFNTIITWVLKKVWRFKARLRSFGDNKNCFSARIKTIVVPLPL